MTATPLSPPGQGASPVGQQTRPAAVSPARGNTAFAGRGGGDMDDTPLQTDALLAPPPGLLSAWQAALLARDGAATAAAAAAGGAGETATATQQVVAACAASTAPGGDALHAGTAVPTLADAPLHIQAEFRAGAGPAWQLGLQRGPDAAAWSLNLANSAVPSAWAATQLPRLERRLRAQGHEVGAHWGASGGQPGPREDADGH